jgi:hypothetical protein
MSVITSMEVVDWRYPTSLSGDGSDAVHTDPDVPPTISLPARLSLCKKIPHPGSGLTDRIGYVLGGEPIGAHFGPYH